MVQEEEEQAQWKDNGQNEEKQRDPPDMGAEKTAGIWFGRWMEQAVLTENCHLFINEACQPASNHFTCYSVLTSRDEGKTGPLPLFMNSSYRSP